MINIELRSAYGGGGKLRFKSAYVPRVGEEILLSESGTDSLNESRVLTVSKVQNVLMNGFKEGEAFEDGVIIYTNEPI